ncbi:O-antigen/teichoic acid export membrane protein [Pararhizobium capsulatum DSM 1112]|uniref:O-antigen/teichoic acid export membrane protein n=1 Tax=Pararhizobium capsulatum DSM 1112 TaxID=1121113 RepID=A0ABU0BLR0_9HYPH|nr:lipopolysaccharide biosynthesis protein [Pararhizobium capsulatum]MDQ0319186.1 O-antigen/teichoic acid export membrane protein [Pararhizobium capsulatum DSM 1112]
MIKLAKMLYARHRYVVQAYLSMTGGSVGRLVLSLVYFICVANGLSIAEFGLFATASAAGIMVSRVLAFGFMSPLYRISTVKPLLIGTYSLGFIVAALASLPLIALICTGVFYAVFAADMAGPVFAAFMAAEIICWRGLEVSVVVLNGLGRFGRASLLVVIGTAIRTVAAVIFALSHLTTLQSWSLFYLTANASSFIIAAVFFFPKVRLRWRPRLYLRRWSDSLSVAGAEVLFYIQSEFDKIAVLSVGGPAVSGLYAIIMRLADLTALPVRTFNTLLVQKIMRTPETISSWRTRLIIEGLVAAVSFAAIATMAIYLWILPHGLGNNVSEAAPYLMAVLLVPSFRNLVEYHSELLYATGATVRRMTNLVVAGVLKMGLLAALLKTSLDVAFWSPMLNGVYLAVYLASFALTYNALTTRRARVI